MAASLRTLLCSFALLMLSLSICQARDFVVGGNKMSWRIPSSPDDFNKWASRNRFLIGDSIVFKYEPNDTDSVLQVSKEDYRTCTKSDPIKSFSEGNTKITLDRSGPFYFISGAQGHCEKGQKIEIVVLSPRPDSGGDQSIAPSPSDTSDLDDHSPAPSPHQDDHHHHHAPAPAPATHHDDHHHHSPAPSPHHSGAFGLKTGLFMSALGLMSFMAFLV